MGLHESEKIIRDIVTDFPISRIPLAPAEILAPITFVCHLWAVSADRLTQLVVSSQLLISDLGHELRGEIRHRLLRWRINQWGLLSLPTPHNAC